MQDLIFKLYVRMSLTMKNLSVVWPFRMENPFFPYQDYSAFNFEMTESECLSEFKFGKRDIPM